MTMHTPNTPNPDAAPLNADPRELDKFGDLAHRWWDPDGEFKPLHDLNPLRVDWIARLAGGLAGKTVLDVGCGGGILAEALAREGATVTGIDLARKSLRVADLHGLESGVAVRYEEIAVEALAAREPASFDVVCCMEMLEHVPDPSAVVAACAKLVKPGGIVFFSTLNRTPKSWLLAIVGAEYLLRMVPRGTHDWARFIRPAELVADARAAQLEPVEITGLHYNPVSRRYTLGGAPDVNYLVACRPQ